jgi:hypothetical protein
MVERRDQVLITWLLREPCASVTFLNSFWSIKGPFFNERGMMSPDDDHFQSEHPR